ncbi:hypothetical protein [Chlamydiifrater volucris]|uniref:hypothetical protein n=1 Tax=Chlamydiifrater volucris TaxID=2681470 RepID=UPI001BD1A8CF|nr:hypothetical protein [Chlamydiifrater volucris]
MNFYSVSSFKFSPVFIQKTQGGSLEKALSLLDRALAVSSRCIQFVDISEKGIPVIREESIQISSLEILAKVVIGVLLLPLTIIAIALKIILRTAFCYKTPSSEEWVHLAPPTPEIEKKQLPSSKKDAPQKIAERELLKDLEPSVSIRNFSETERSLLKTRLKNSLSEEEMRPVEKFYAEVRDLISRRQRIEAISQEMQTEIARKEETLMQIKQLEERLQKVAEFTPEDYQVKPSLSATVTKKQEEVQEIDRAIQELEEEQQAIKNHDIQTKEDLQRKFNVVILSEKDLSLEEDLIFEYPDTPGLTGKRFFIRNPKAMRNGDGYVLYSSFERGRLPLEKKVASYTSMFTFWQGSKEAREALLREEQILQVGYWNYQPAFSQLGEQIMVIAESSLSHKLLNEFLERHRI